MSKKYDLSFLIDMLEGDVESIKEIIDIFIKNTPEIISSIGLHIEKTNWEAASEEAHKVKSSLKLFLLNDEAEIAYFIEKNGANKTNLDEIKVKYQELKNNVLSACEEIKLDSEKI